MRATAGVALVSALCCAAACTGKPSPVAPPSARTSAASSPAVLPETLNLNCSDPIDTVSAPTGSLSSILDVVGLETTSTLQLARTDGSDPHRLFAKTPLLVHAAREATLTVPADWDTQVSIAWGNQAAGWTTSLHIPGCPEPPSGSGQWLVFPGGFSLDKAACVPLEVRTGAKTTTVHVSVGTRCPA
jgi:hypothetical protein